MMAFASRAAFATTCSSCGSICARIRAASARSRAASRSASAARAPSVDWLAPSRTIWIPLNSRQANDDGDGQAEHDVNSAHVIERAGGEVGAQHQELMTSTRVRSSMPASGDSTSISSDVAVMRSGSAAAAVGSIDSTAVPSRSSRLSSQLVHGAGDTVASAEQHTRETLSREAVLVIHRRLMHHVGQRFFVFLRTVAEEDQVAGAHDRNGRVLGTHVHDQPVALERARPMPA